MANKLGSWNLDEFITFLLIHSSYADLEFTPEEEKLVKSYLSADDYKAIVEAYDNMGEFEITETIQSYKGIHYPTSSQKQELLGRMKQLFKADGDYSKLERKLYDFYTKLL